MSKEKMVMFTGDMVRAILDGSKTQTRRPCRVQPLHDNWELHRVIGDSEREGWRHFAAPGEVMMERGVNCTKFFHPSLQPGDTMLVRERARRASLIVRNPGLPDLQSFVYEADGEWSGYITMPKRLKPIKIGHCVPNGCFKELVRIKRKVVRVWYEQIQSISEEDIIREGIDISCNYGMNIDHVMDGCDCVKDRFVSLWESIYPGSWDRNDWCECTEFEGKALK